MGTPLILSLLVAAPRLAVLDVQARVGVSADLATALSDAVVVEVRRQNPGVGVVGSDEVRTMLSMEKQRALLAYLDEAVGREGEVSDKTFAELSRQFSTREIVEVTMIAAQYMGTSMFTNALRVRIHPNDVVSLHVVGKQPGQGWRPQPQDLVFAEPPGSDMPANPTNPISIRW